MTTINLEEDIIKLEAYIESCECIRYSLYDEWEGYDIRDKGKHEPLFITRVLDPDVRKYTLRLEFRNTDTGDIINDIRELIKPSIHNILAEPIASLPHRRRTIDVRLKSRNIFGVSVYDGGVIDIKLFKRPEIELEYKKN